VSQELGIKYINPEDENIAPPHEKQILKYMAQLKDGELLSEYELLILAIFNCKGSGTTKAQILFENKDREL
jgi:hypothetical protein